MLLESSIPVTEIAYSSGFNSLRRFNDAFKKMFDRSPRQLRSKERSYETNDIEITLPYRPGYQFAHMLDFLSARCITGVEKVQDGIYSRTIRYLNTYGDYSRR